MARIMQGAAEVSKAQTIFRKLQRLIGLAESTTLTVLAACPLAIPQTTF